MSVDTEWFLRINSWARDTPWLHPALAGYALWGGLSVLALLLVGGWWWARGQGERAPHAVAVAVLTGVATVAALLVNQRVISPLIARARPCQSLAHVQVLLACSSDYSMPSDHCVLAGAFAAGLCVLRRAVGILAALAALLVGFTRVYVGVHYPADVLTGLGVGAVFALAIVLGLRGPAARLATRGVGTRCAVLVSRDATHSRADTANARR